MPCSYYKCNLDDRDAKWSHETDLSLKIMQRLPDDLITAQL